MKQKDICFADLNPTQGREQSGVRPVVVISNNVLNSNLDICIVCPLTSQRKGYAGSVLIPKNAANGLVYDSEVITFQVRAISKDRLFDKTGSVTNAQLKEILETLNMMF
jgi:mRNA interferase MazF